MGLTASLLRRLLGSLVVFDAPLQLVAAFRRGYVLDADMDLLGNNATIYLPIQK